VGLGGGDDIIEERGADKKPGPMGKGLCGEGFFVLIFCFFSIKRKEGAPAATSGECSLKALTVDSALLGSGSA
jgi:hypothetical protein